MEPLNERYVTQEEAEQMHLESIPSLLSEQPLFSAQDMDSDFENLNNSILIEDIKYFSDLNSLKSFMMGNELKSMIVKISLVLNADRDINVHVVK